MIHLLTYEEYEKSVQSDPLWKSYKARWQYHAEAIQLIKGLDINAPRQVLEIGSFGAGLVKGSDRMDLPDGEWSGKVEKGTILHDARELPWPLHPLGRYRLVIALRVWHHLWPMQKECFMEAKRISKYVLIECPEQEIVGKGISRDDFLCWNYGVPPIALIDLGGWGIVYLWRGCL